jgi:CRP/FNR family transcriptional regulator, cyclic AMP receptor protein
MPGRVADDAVIRLLAGTELFRSLAADDLAVCAGRFREARFAKNEMLFGRGDPGNHLHVVAEGQVRLAIATDEGRELSFQIAVPGDLFGEIAVLDSRPRSAEATAITPVTTYALERSAFRELWSAHPSISNAIITFLCWRLRDASDRLEAIALYPMEVRLARFLLVALGDRRAAPGRRVPLELGFTQSELALLLGASRPKINAALGTLENAGAIGRTSDRLFCDPAKLAQIAQRNDS